MHLSKFTRTIIIRRKIPFHLPLQNGCCYFFFLHHRLFFLVRLLVNTTSLTRFYICTLPICRLYYIYMLNANYENFRVRFSHLTLENQRRKNNFSRRIRRWNVFFGKIEFQCRWSEEMWREREWERELWCVFGELNVPNAHHIQFYFIFMNMSKIVLKAILIL